MGGCSFSWGIVVYRGSGHGHVHAKLIGYMSRGITWTSATAQSPIKALTLVGSPLLPADLSQIESYLVEDLRFPTSLTGDGTDAMQKSCDCEWLSDPRRVMSTAFVS